ncbi:hypothetical protein WJ41_34460 [Burkholderia ubonensis]|uniref:Copper uptake system-associated protein n=2 Tax=Burkholderia ubonensis TaxID=101571 RepID=A0ABD4E666_9BURK|nr:hypothetical protein WJ41_34460 [Burkholderia ubonensis]KVN88870.1 hypothetical protein WJ68_04945 [Burkholderia ubonensis]KVU05024.1 hypothetical protein WK61_32360 [Burkholderia ubonensis]KWO78705.1 hypothetical protein WM32_31145 [Burkholderia ubonensis]
MLVAFAALGVALDLPIAPVHAADSMVAESAQQQIRALLSATYDKPGAKVEVEAVAVSGRFAIADWTQHEMAGRALMRHVNGRWEIAACGGDALKAPGWLKDAGVSATDTKNLLSQLTVAERQMSVKKVRRFGLFGTKPESLAASSTVETP